MGASRKVWVLAGAALAVLGGESAHADSGSPGGFYIGTGLIANFGDVDYHFMDTGERGSLDPDGVGVTLLGGYLWRRGPWVYGIEGTYSAFDSSESTVTTSGVTFQQESNWAWSARGRLGNQFGDNLVYATGGFARTSITHSASNAGGRWENTEQRDGWLAGLGYERRLNSNIALRVEWTHSEYETATCLPPPPTVPAPSTPEVDYQTSDVGVSVVFTF